MISERQVLRLAAPFVGVPYRRHGSDPSSGWDCWGCVRYLRREIFGLESPSWSVVYTAADACDPARVETLILEHLHAWEPVEPRPGAALLLRVFNRRAHVALMLTPRLFIHTLAGQETTTVRLDDSRWESRIEGAYDTRSAASDHRAGAVHSAG